MGCQTFFASDSQNLYQLLVIVFAIFGVPFESLFCSTSRADEDNKIILPINIKSGKNIVFFLNIEYYNFNFRGEGMKV